MPKTNRTSDRAHVIMSFDLNQRDFEDFISEVKSSKFFPHLIGLEVKRPNLGNPVVGLGALLLREFPSDSDSNVDSDLLENGVPQMENLSEISDSDEEVSFNDTDEEVETDDSQHN